MLIDLNNDEIIYLVDILKLNNDELMIEEETEFASSVVNVKYSFVSYVIN